ncbi:MAG: alpha/beta fold hydrolase [Gammaproteobacteria bacterium]
MPSPTPETRNPHVEDGAEPAVEPRIMRALIGSFGVMAIFTRIGLGSALPATVFGMLFALCTGAFAGQYVRVSPDLEIYYEEAGTGTPMVFIPGWTLTTEVFSKQRTYFASRYRAITYDPRGQGRSSKTLDNNHYTQHGADLKALMDILHLKDVVVIAHSYGCFDAYAYFRAFGSDNVKAFVCIDESPKPIVQQQGDWGFLTTFDDLRAFSNDIIHSRREAMPGVVRSMVGRKLADGEIDWLVEEMMKTPNFVALPLGFSGDLADYTEDAKTLDAKIPILYVLRQADGWTTAGSSWLKKHMPNSRAIAFGSHLMFWELPDRFNSALDAFLEKLR